MNHPEDELRDAMERFQGCIERRDRAAAESVLDTDFALVLVQPARAVMPRARWLEVLTDYMIHSYAVQDEIVDVDGDLAVVLHRDELSATVLGEDRSGTFIVTDVWRRTEEGWKVWRRHSTPVTAGKLPGVT